MRLIVRCRGINIRPVKSVKIAPSVSKAFYEMIINTGPDDYRVTLTPAMFGELLRSAKDALEGRVPAVEERAATKLPMHAGNMLLVRLNEDGLKRLGPEKLYLKIFKALEERLLPKIRRRNRAEDNKTRSYQGATCRRTRFPFALVRDMEQRAVRWTIETQRYLDAENQRNERELGKAFLCGKRRAYDNSRSLN
jgi:hypothetical protein